MTKWCQRLRLVIFLAATSCAIWLTSVPATAEWYGAEMIGAVLPNRLEDVRNGRGVSYGNLSSAPGLALGVKLGYYLPQAHWFGVETEAFGAFPNVKRQSAPGTGPGCPCRLDTTGGHMRVVTWAFNAVVRYPGKQFQPYAGAGLGLFFADFSDTGSWDKAVPGLNVLAGARYFFWDQFAFFAEYKYNRASFEFPRALDTPAGLTSLKMDYSASLVMVGASFHWE